ISSTTIRDRLVLVQENLRPLGVTLVNASGLTADGNPYLDLTGTNYGGDGSFAPAERLEIGSLTYSNPGQGRIEFQGRLLVYPTLRNHLPEITSQPETAATVGQTYQYQVTAS